MRGSEQGVSARYISVLYHTLWRVKCITHFESSHRDTTDPFSRAFWAHRSVLWNLCLSGLQTHQLPLHLRSRPDAQSKALLQLQKVRVLRVAPPQPVTHLRGLRGAMGILLKRHHGQNARPWSLKAFLNTENKSGELLNQPAYRCLLFRRRTNKRLKILNALGEEWWTEHLSSAIKCVKLHQSLTDWIIAHWIKYFS